MLFRIFRVCYLKCGFSSSYINDCHALFHFLLNTPNLPTSTQSSPSSSREQTTSVSQPRCTIHLLQLDSSQWLLPVHLSPSSRRTSTSWLLCASNWARLIRSNSQKTWVSTPPLPECDGSASATEPLVTRRRQRLKVGSNVSIHVHILSSVHKDLVLFYALPPQHRKLFTAGPRCHNDAVCMNMMRCTMILAMIPVTDRYFGSLPGILELYQALHLPFSSFPKHLPTTPHNINPTPKGTRLQYVCHPLPRTSRYRLVASNGENQGQKRLHRQLGDPL
jgi:hypothetical protein